RDGLRKVLERCPAHDEIEGVPGKGHRRRIPYAEVHAHRFLPRSLRRELDEGLADIESDDFVSPALCQLDRRVSGTRGDVEDATTPGCLVGEAVCQRAEFSDVFGRVLRVPRRDSALHPDALIPFVLMPWHDGSPSYFPLLLGARSACHFFHSVRNPQ